LESGSLPTLFPSFQLLPNYTEKKVAYDNYLKWGGYPILHKDVLSDAEKESWLQDYVRTYLERDIRDLAVFKNLEPFIRVQQMSALLTGQTINFSYMARQASIHSLTAQRFMHYMELSYQTILLAPRHRNPLKRLSKMPKLHYLDPGVQQMVANKTIGTLNGNAFESAIVAEIYKQAKNSGAPVSFFHLRTVDGREVDLLIETDQGCYAFEIKQSESVHKTDARGLIGLQEILDKPILTAFVLSNDPETKMLTEQITAVHAGMFLS
jgi:predicted AAA+ superfamily ATPase